MSENQKKKTNIKCTKCNSIREVTLGHLQKKTNKGNLLCRSCVNLGRKMSDEARKKMSDSKKKLVASGWLPEFARKYKGTGTPYIKKGLLKPLDFVNCTHCSKNFKKQKQSQTFCSKQCANRYRVANGTHHLWKGGITPINFLVRAMTEYKQWKQEVIERDGFICKECNVSSFRGHFKLMHVDHIVPLSFLIKVNKIKSTKQARQCSKLWNTDNGRVLCKECHEKTPTFMRKASNYQLV